MARVQITSIIRRLHEVLGKVEEYKERAEELQYPNDERIEKLENEADLIQQAIAALEEIE